MRPEVQSGRLPKPPKGPGRTPSQRSSEWESKRRQYQCHENRLYWWDL